MNEEQGCAGAGPSAESLAESAMRFAKERYESDKRKLCLDQGGIIPVDQYQRALDFIDGLRSRGVTRFSGLGINLELGWIPDEKTPFPAPAQTNVETVDIGGGLLIPKKDAEDLFGHER